MVESAIIKKSLLIHRLPTAGRWGLNKRSQCRVDLGEEDAPCIHSHRGLCHRASVGSPSHLPAGHLPEKLPLPPDTHGTPAQGQYPIEGFRMLGVLTSLLSLFPLLRLTLASLPSPNSPFSLTVYFPAREPFATVGPLILPSRFAEPAVLGLGRCWAVFIVTQSKSSRFPASWATATLQHLMDLNLSCNPPVSGVGFWTPMLPLSVSLACSQSNF